MLQCGCKSHLFIYFSSQHTTASSSLKTVQYIPLYPTRHLFIFNSNRLVTLLWDSVSARSCFHLFIFIYSSARGCSPAIYTHVHIHPFIYLFTRRAFVSGCEGMHPFMDAFYLFILIVHSQPYVQWCMPWNHPEAHLFIYLFDHSCITCVNTYWCFH